MIARKLRWLFYQILSLVGISPLCAIFVGGIPVDGVDVIERVSAEVLAGVFYDDLGAYEVVGGIAAGGEGAIPGEVGFFVTCPSLIRPPQPSQSFILKSSNRSFSPHPPKIPQPCDHKLPIS